MRRVIEKYLEKGSIVVTDGYSSYPSAIKELGYKHHLINHTVGFVNEDGFHTNNIENLLIRLKYEYRSRGGINECKFSLFLSEFIWKKKN